MIKKAPGRRRSEDRAALYETKEFREAQRRLGANVRRARLAAQWTQEEAAFRCEMPVRLYVSVEHGDSNATLVTLARLAAGLEIDVADLLSRTGR